MTKLRRMRLVVYVAQVGEMRRAYKFSVGKTKGKRPLRYPGVNGRYY
jgi:hypothetical protein